MYSCINELLPWLSWAVPTPRSSAALHYLLLPGVLGLVVEEEEEGEVVFLEMVGILEGLPPLRVAPEALVSDTSEQADCVSSRSKSEASLPLRLLARLPALLPARLDGRLTEEAPRFDSLRLDLALVGVPWFPFSPVREPRLEWKVGRFSLEPDVTSEGLWWSGQLGN